MGLEMRIVECCEDSKCPAALGRLLSGLSSAQGNSYTRGMIILVPASALFSPNLEFVKEKTAAVLALSHFGLLPQPGPGIYFLESQSSAMNPVYSPVQPGAPYGNPKNMAYTGYPTGYPTAAPAYNPNMYPTSSPGYAPATLLMKQAWPQTSSSCATEGTFHLPVDTGTENRTYQASSAAFRYTAGTPYKVPPTQSNSAPPPYSPSPNPYQTAMYPIRSAYPQQNLYAQGAYYTQPVYAAQPHVIHHTTVVQPNSIPSAIYPAPVAAPRTNGVAMGMVAGTTMAMSAGTLLTTPQHTAIGAHPVSVPTYRAQGAPTYSYVPPHW
ncbi:protein FAM168A isoform X4 [Pelodiscus sinensis]|uniref:protein FAM168A isoform X4 n=1 Tax=Pelodiscus sinensis TaxID=13735 RepID=UPI003F6CB662